MALSFPQDFTRFR